MSDLISPKDLHQAQEAGQGPRIVDVRGPDEYAVGHIPGAESRPAEELERNLDALPRDKPIVVY